MANVKKARLSKKVNGKVDSVISLAEEIIGAAPKTAKANKPESVQLEKLVIQSMNVAIEGLSPLIMHKFSDEAMVQIENKQRQKTKQKEARIAEEKEIERCIHRRKDGKICFPSSGFYNGVVEVAPYFSDLDKKKVAGALKILDADGDPFVKITFTEMEVRKDNVRLSSGVADIRYRPSFHNWKANLRVQFNSQLISPQQVISLLNYSGFHRGCGDWRPGSPRKPGSFGMYQVSPTRK